jgi:hypothetical protein
MFGSVRHGRTIRPVVLSLVRAGSHARLYCTEHRSPTTNPVATSFARDTGSSHRHLGLRDSPRTNGGKLAKTRVARPTCGRVAAATGSHTFRSQPPKRPAMQRTLTRRPDCEQKSERTLSDSTHPQKTGKRIILRRDRPTYRRPSIRTRDAVCSSGRASVAY